MTGASGVVGQAILREIASRRPVISLVHRGNVTAGGTEVLRCDLSASHCGLSMSDYRSVVDRIVAVVHSAALTEWGQPSGRYEAVNVDGTRQVVELAARAAAPVHYISTAFVAALAGTPSVTLRADNVTAPYIRSKRQGEVVLAESGVPHSVYRPTNLVGDSRTGRTARPQIVQLVSDWVCRGRARIFPVHPQNLLDVVPQDVLAKAVVRAIERGETGGDYWVTHGARAMTMAAAIDILVEHARDRGREIAPPRLVHPDDISADDMSALPPMSRTFVQVLSDVSEVTAACGGALPSSMGLLVPRFGLPDVPDTDAYRRTLRVAVPDPAAVADRPAT
ncbi:MAG TPA: SDR family oxidoreductase [Pseudonocardiaceae bacterium]